MIDVLDTTTDTLSNVVLWMIFGTLVTMLNCDLQVSIRNNPIFLHVMAFTAIFFLFTLLDNDHTRSLPTACLQSLYVYVLFLMLIKSKIYFLIPIFILLMIDQAIKYEYNHRKKNGKKLWNQQVVSNIITFTIIVLLILGVADYYKLQVKEYKSKFSWINFIFGIGCKRIGMLSVVKNR